MYVTSCGDATSLGPSTCMTGPNMILSYSIRSVHVQPIFKRDYGHGMSIESVLQIMAA